MLDTSYGFNNLLKEGHKHFSGFEEVVLRNINSVKEISNMVKKSLGPNGMKKMVVNHIDKTFVTSDAATILKQLQVQHPAAKMVVMASKMQQQQCGDGTNLVVTIAGQLLSHAQNLIRMGLHPSQIIVGYQEASKKALSILQEIQSFKIEDPRNENQVTKALKSTLTSKIPNHGEFFAKLVARACINSLPNAISKFDIDNVRILNVMGGSVTDSTLMSGMVIKRGVQGTISRVSKPRIAVYSCPLDTVQAQTKGTVLIRNAQDLLNYSKGEEDLAEKFIKKIVDANVNVVVTGGTISDIVLHFLEKYRIMTVRVMSKFELKRVSRALSAGTLSKLQAPTPEQIGQADEVFVQQLGSEKLVVFKRQTEDCKLSTILLRGSTKNLLEDIQRAIDDGINVFRSILRDGTFVPGAGSTQTILSIRLENEAKQIQGLDQYSYSRFAKTFEIIPRILAENAGLNSNQIIPKMISANNTTPHGINISTGAIESISKLDVHDHRKTKEWAIRLASDTAVTILKIDQIIIAKPAGGPKPQQNKNYDNDE